MTLDNNESGEGGEERQACNEAGWGKGMFLEWKARFFSPLEKEKEKNNQIRVGDMIYAVLRSRLL